MTEDAVLMVGTVGAAVVELVGALAVLEDASPAGEGVSLVPNTEAVAMLAAATKDCEC